MNPTTTIEGVVRRVQLPPLAVGVAHLAGNAPGYFDVKGLQEALEKFVGARVVIMIEEADAE